MFDVGVSIEEFARLAPGPELAAVLARVDLSVLNGYEAVEVVKGPLSADCPPSSWAAGRRAGERLLPIRRP